MGADGPLERHPREPPGQREAPPRARADPKADATGGEANLASALLAGHLDRASLLLARGADPNARGKRGRTALMEAAQKDRLDEVRFLLAHGADPNLHDDAGATALSLASPRVAEQLLAAKADPNHRDVLGRTAFFGGFGEGDPATLRLLVERGADVRTLDARWRTVLLGFLEADHLDGSDFSVGGKEYRLVEWLLRLGVPVDARETGVKEQGKDALEVASQRHGLLHVRALLEGHPCPPAFGGRERAPWEDMDTAARVALLARQPTRENRYALYRSLRYTGTIGTAKSLELGTFVDPGWHIPRASGTDGAPLAVVYGGLVPAGKEPAGYRPIEMATLLRIAADNRVGLLVTSGIALGDPAVEVPPADVALIRRCVPE